MSHFRFESSQWLNLLWLIPLIYFWGRVLGLRAKKKWEGGIHPKLGAVLTASLSLKRRLWKRRIELLVLGLLILAYARPQTGEGREAVKNEGIELLILVDVSNSMLAEDIKPSRLHFARSELSRLVEMSSGNRMALVAFAGSAALLSPLTTDQDALKMYIESLSVDAVSTQGTNFTNALKEAADAFQRGGMGDQVDAQVTRAVVVASDGEDHEVGAYDEAKKLRESGIHIFSLAFGTEEGAPIPVHDNQGQLRGYKRDKNHQPVMSKTKGTVLKELARIGEGSFYHATFQNDAIGALHRDIGKLKKSQFESGEMRIYQEKFQAILMIALILALIELWLGERKGKGRIWRGRFEVPRD